MFLNETRIDIICFNVEGCTALCKVQREENIQIILFLSY